MPANKVIVNALEINSSVPGVAPNWLTAAKTNREMAVVGPETRCFDEPKRAAIMGVTMAV